MRGASVNFQKIHSAMHAVSHASRQVPPQYLLPPEHSLGTHVVIDDKGEVQKKLTEKMALASRQAKASKDYSPLWEGVINLPHPSASITAQHQIQIVKAWCEQYEAITGHKVLRADVHLDEGFVDASGKPQFNAHAHVMCDRTDAAGKVIKLSPKQLREVQGMTAEVTQLQRGKDARKTGRQHLNHVQYRFVAEQGRQKLEQTKVGYEQLFDTQLGVLKEHRGKAKTLAVELAEAKALAEQYKAERDALKASGVAKQADYQALKQHYEAAKEALTKAKAEAVEAKQEATQAKAQAVAAQEQAHKLAALAQQYKVERDALKASGVAKQADYQTLKQQYEAAKEALTKAKAEAVEAKAQTTAVQQQLQKATAIANQNYELAKAAKAQLEVAQEEAKEAKEGQRLFNDELERTYDRMIKAEQKLYKLEKAQTQPTPQPTPEKSLQERISTSFEAMLEWVKQQGGKLRELNKANGLAIGPIEHIDDYHCVQSQGRGDYCIHRLDELDRVPRTDVTYEEIYYRDGRGHVKPQREQGMDFGR